MLNNFSFKCKLFYIFFLLMAFCFQNFIYPIKSKSRTLQTFEESVAKTSNKETFKAGVTEMFKKVHTITGETEGFKSALKTALDNVKGVIETIGDSAEKNEDLVFYTKLINDIPNVWVSIKKFKQKEIDTFLRPYREWYAKEKADIRKFEEEMRKKEEKAKYQIEKERKLAEAHLKLTQRSKSRKETEKERTLLKRVAVAEAQLEELRQRKAAIKDLVTQLFHLQVEREHLNVEVEKAQSIQFLRMMQSGMVKEIEEEGEKKKGCFSGSSSTELQRQAEDQIKFAEQKLKEKQDLELQIQNLKTTLSTDHGICF